MPSLRHSSAMLSSPRKPAITILFFRRILPPGRAPDIPNDLLAFLQVTLPLRSHLRSFRGYDEQTLSPSIPPFCLIWADGEQLDRERSLHATNPTYRHLTICFYFTIGHLTRPFLASSFLYSLIPLLELAT
jgi:hypothetical protein